ncbi:MAG TPA: diaminopimelate decarboxylase [Bryobacteraceae bacterium]|nr:diaminopimelate decarboxylase [Bryobacteraceae bacterium]
MQPFTYRDNTLYCDETPLADIARRTGTPAYVYSKSAILDRFRAYDDAFGVQPHRVCYAVKANSNLAILRLLAEAGAGFDIVSGGELFRVLKAGGDPQSIVFSGVGKTADEIDCALQAGIHGFNCESETELGLIDSLAARRALRAHIALRVNPDVDAATHPYISTGLREHKFGVDMHDAEALYARALALPNLIPHGVSCHIGSQILDPAPMLESLDKMLELIKRLRARGVPLTTLDLGGGLGVPYKPGEKRPAVAPFLETVCSRVAGRDLTVLVEPGRSIVGEAGVLITRVLYRKTAGAKEFVIVDAAMNDLIRPALYQSHHEIIPLRKSDRGRIRADVVGPVCESGDFLARAREMDNVMPGDLLAICTAGAYGFVQSSNYNSRPRACEVLVDGAEWRVVRRRETYEDLIRGEM